MMPKKYTRRFGFIKNVLHVENFMSRTSFTSFKELVRYVEFSDLIARLYRALSEMRPTMPYSVSMLLK